MDRMTGLGIAIGGAFLLLGARFFQLQVVDGERWARTVEVSRLVREPLPPLRGRILDRHGEPLADTRSLYHLGVVMADLELEGRARRVPLLALDRRRFLGLCAELAGRIPRNGRPVTEAVAAALADEPSVALRGSLREAEPGALVAVPAAALAPDQDVPETDALGATDLLDEDPRVAIARELGRRRNALMTVLDEAQFTDACRTMDLDFGQPDGRIAEALGPFTARLEPLLPVDAQGPALEGRPAPAAPVRLPLRAAPTAVLDQGVEMIAALLGEDVPVVRARWDRALAAAARPAPASRLVYGSALDAEAIAPRLPEGFRLDEIALPAADDPERIWILQGDPPDDEGALGILVRRAGPRLGIAPDLLRGLLEKHGEPITPGISERRWNRRHLVVDPVACERLVESLAERLTRLGLPTDPGELRTGLAEVRRTAERHRAGTTRHDPILLRRDLDPALARRLDGLDAQPPDDLARAYAAAPPLPGLRVVAGIGRAWPAGDSAVHLLGQLGNDPDAPWPGALKGTTGLEKTYDDRLRGLAGSRVRLREADGLREVLTTPPIDGLDLVTEIDLQLQQVAEDALARRLELAEEIGTLTDRMTAAAKVGRGRAGFVLMDVHTGGVLVLASNPRYQPEQLRARWADLVKDPAGPLHDWSCEADQAPGSSFKILTMLAGLEQGVVSPGEVIVTKGYMAMVRGQKVLRDHAAPGPYTLAEGIRESSNEYSAIIAERLHRRFGPGFLVEYARRFGLGQRPGLDIDQARAGILPHPDSLRRLRPREPRWGMGDTWHLGIGQFCAASPLQVVTIAAAVANGGHIVQPFLVRPPGGPVVDDIKVRQDWLEDVRNGMEQVTGPDGTAKYLTLDGAGLGIKVAAKTGTAEWGSASSRASGRTPDHAWMIGYAPADRPTVAFAVFVHSGTFGGLACTPIAKRILEAYFQRYGHDGHPAAGVR
ncbi:MAG: penicillin-binding protein 2 [Planctomycetota bacterium]|jgi:penicillin-binding protein 2